MTETASRRGSIANIVTAVAFGFVYAYPTWSAIGNLIGMPAFYASFIGVGADRVPWALLWSSVAVPVVVFGIGLALGWRRGPGAIALLLAAGFGVVCAVSLDVIAVEIQIRLNLITEFLLNGG